MKISWYGIQMLRDVNFMVLNSDVILGKIKYRDKDFMILGLDSIKEGFEFRNKNFSLDAIGNRFGTNISLYRGYVLYSVIYLGYVFLFFCVGKASHDAIETLEAGGFACCSGI